MLLIPAIDIKEGRCVRLYQGKYEEETEYSTDPVAVAVDFEARGAKRLHVVDLDGAIIDSSRNFELIESICRRVNIPVECGGGIRNIAMAKKFLDAGVAEIILGTVIIKNPDVALDIIGATGSDRVQVGLDFSGEQIAIRGWKELVPGSLVKELRKWNKKGIQQFILTDITRDGTMQGPNITSLRSIAEETDVKITASGGISHPDDILKVCELELLGVNRIISGKAVYEGAIKIEDYA